MITKYSILACAMVSSLAFAQDNLTPVDNYGQSTYLGLSATFSATQDSEESESLDEFGFDVQAGYFFLPYLGLEASYGLDSGLFHGDNFEHTDLMVLTRYPLSDYAELYLGAGASVMLNDDVKTDGSNVDAVGTFGVRYHISQSWGIDLGYKFYNDPGAWESSVGTLALGAKYYFGGSEPAPAPVYVPPQPKPEPKPPVKEVVCHTESVATEYMVKDGDWLNKIAVNHGMSLDELIALNSSEISKLNNINLILPGMKIEVLKDKEICK